jgi:protein TonB
VKIAPSETAFTAPVTIPERVAPEEALDLGAGAGEPGGVEGGVPGGVVGAVVGGLPLPREPEVPIVKVGGEIREPKKLRHVNPTYPELAARARVQGTVVLECLVSPNGQIMKVSVLRSIPLLDAAAMEAVRQWTYTPTLKDGVPVKVLLTVSVRFALER